MDGTVYALWFFLLINVVYGQIGYLIPQLQSNNAFGWRRNILNLQSSFTVDDGRLSGFHRHRSRGGRDRFTNPDYDQVVYFGGPDSEADARNVEIKQEEGSISLPTPYGNDNRVFVFLDSDEKKPRSEAVVTADRHGNAVVPTNTSGAVSEHDAADTNLSTDKNPDETRDQSTNTEVVDTPNDSISSSINFETPATAKVQDYSSGSTELPELTPVPKTESRSVFGQGIFRETCTTSAGGVGTCIVLTSCDSLYSKLRDNPSDGAVISELRTAHCGFQGTDPKVCCPNPGFSETIPTESPQPPQTSPVAEVPTTTSSAATSLLEPPECGFSNASFSRVVNGVPAKLGDFPWMALLGYRPRRDEDGPRWLCGGSLVSRRHVLTAAHCIHKHEHDLYIVRLGDLDISRDDDGATPIDVPIVQAEKHEDYSPTAFTNDIGLLVLQHEVKFTPLIQPICLPTESELRARSFENYNPIIAGWGDTEFRGPAATHLQALQLPVVSNEFCAKAYSAYKNQQIDERVLCAGYKHGGRDACQGDSGGPLMQPIWSQQTYKTYFYQIGVVSFGKKCAEAGFPGVYTRVTYFVPWLQRKITGTTT